MTVARHGSDGAAVWRDRVLPWPLRAACGSALGLKGMETGAD